MTTVQWGYTSVTEARYNHGFFASYQNDNTLLFIRIAHETAIGCRYLLLLFPGPRRNRWCSFLSPIYTLNVNAPVYAEEH